MLHTTANDTQLRSRKIRVCWRTTATFSNVSCPKARLPLMQDSSSRSPSPGNLEQRNHAEAAQKTTCMWSDGGTQTKDIGRMDQEVWMGYNYVNLAVSLAGCGTGGKSPALQGVCVSPLFPGGFTQMPFCPATPAIPKTGHGTVPGFYARANLPHGSIWSPLGLPWSFHGTPRLWVSVVRLFQS